MSLRRNLAAGLWLSVFAGACGLDTAWAGTALPASKVQPWVLVALFWAVALISVAIHHLARHIVRGGLVLMRSAVAHTSRSLQAAQKAPAALARLAEAVTSSLSLRWMMLTYAWEQHAASARRAPRAVIGWSRSALRALRT